jgi:hypothetical protein
VLAYLESHRRTIEPHIRSVADQTDIQVMNDLDLASPVGIDCKLAIDAMAGYLVIADGPAHPKAVESLILTCRIYITG